MAEKIYFKKFFRQLKLSRGQAPTISHFLPLTHNLKHDSGGRARQDSYSFAAPLLAFPLKKLK
jgi:hypothetical protein